MHLAEAADQLLEHLAAIEGTILPDQGILAVLARAGAQLLVSGIELDGAHHAAQRLRGQVSEVSSSPTWRRFSRSYVSRARLTAAQADSPSAAGSDDRRPYRPHLMEVLAGPGPGDAEVCGGGLAGLAEAALTAIPRSGSASCSGRFTPPQGQVTPDAARA